MCIILLISSSALSCIVLNKVMYHSLVWFHRCFQYFSILSFAVLFPLTKLFSLVFSSLCICLKACCINSIKVFSVPRSDLTILAVQLCSITGFRKYLIKSYLGNRFQKVKLNNATSHLESVNVGVPQGTILGPLLFLLYINDLLLDVPEDEIVSYADDTAVVTSAKTWKEVEIKMNETLHKLSTWPALNKLSLNTDKTVYIEFGNQVGSTPKNLDINKAQKSKELKIPNI